MKIQENPVTPAMEDILMTAIQLAAQELAEVYPQKGNSIELWKGHLIQQALKIQAGFTEEERFAYARDVLCKERCHD